MLRHVLQVCKMVFDMTGGTKEYLRMAVDENGVEYLGEEYLLEYRELAKLVFFLQFYMFKTNNRLG